MTARRLLTLALLVLGLVALCAGSAGAATSGAIATFELPPACDPPALGAAPREGVLLRLCGSSAGAGGGELSRGATLASVLPDGQLVERTVPKAGGGPVAAAPDGTLWVAANVPLAGRGPALVDRIDPDGGIRRFRLSATPPGATPHVIGLAVGPAGEVWASVGTGVPFNQALLLGGSRGGKLVRIAADGTKTSFPLPRPIEPLAVVEAPDGTLWFTAVGGRRFAEHFFDPGTAYVGRITPAGRLRLQRSPRQSGALTSIAVAADGGLLVADPEPRAIETVDPDGGFGRRYELGADAPQGLAVGPEGDFWVAAQDHIVRITPAGGRTHFDIPASAVVAGAEGDIWAVTGTSLTRVDPRELPN